MRVAMLIWSYWPAAQGGAERQCRCLSPYIQEQGVEVRVWTARLTLALPRKEQDGPVQIERLGGPLLPFILGVQRLLLRPLARFMQGRQALAFWLHLPCTWLARLCFMGALAWKMGQARKDIHLVHVHESGWLGALAIALGNFFHLPVLCKVATYPPFPCIGWDVPWARALRRFQRQGHFMALNSQVQQEIWDSGCPPERVRVLPNAVRLPQEQAHPERANTVLYVGNFSQGAALKGFDLLFAAWAEVAPALPQSRLVLAGGGDTQFWQAEAERLGCRDSVVFQGFVTELSPLYREAALFVLPSRVEGMSNALLEAMSWGLPVIASDILGNRAVVRPHENGLLVPTRASALAEAILHLMQNPELRAQWGAAGRQRMQEDFQPSRVASHLVQWYSSLTGRTG